MKVKSLSHVRLFATPWTVACQASLSMGFSRQEYWSGLPFPSPGDLPDSGIEPGSPAFQEDTLASEPPGKPIFVLIVSLFFDFCLVLFVSYEFGLLSVICPHTLLSIYSLHQVL